MSHLFILSCSVYDFSSILLHQYFTQFFVLRYASPSMHLDWRFPSLRIHSYPKDQSTHAWKMHCMPTEIIAYQPIPVFQRLLHSNDIYFPYFQTRYTTLIMFNTVCSSSPNPVFTLTKVIARKKGKHWIGSPCHSAESS
ncbi:Schizosaccharomyces pombe specific protein [Schizosaccharomyces pombe]|uniref:Uncharacterized protein C191.06 n=1 Tax=Schizosaccharomyces pombe (strain 972 / ATCC 24843) TaxID=284812 RepID=YQ66_SCHPO|nr:uncharacterized protein SPCC191.06 [Schizosaccharomyces pombe]Q9Y7Q0.1 RecName: Full=Uncharacterized protein C191.06 [Schizosaccharomyces pombe 972h-]CAB41052.1 sequence orphan [Schizosaccharomyces pombe]|eukprot:NP_001342886.1 uncharacterized protein SPCC191.06 [Schizosaccharomyces pombe]